MLALRGLALAIVSVVAAGLLAPAAARAESFDCGGTEPFWSLDIQRGGMILERPDAARVIYRYVAPRTARGTTLDFVRVYQTTARRGAARPMTLVVRQDASCSDGMSDTAYSHSITLISAAEVLEGCCRLR